MLLPEKKKARKLTEADGIFLCEPCHDIESKGQAPVLAKVYRQEAKHLGVVTRQKVKIPSRPKPPKPERQRKDSPFAHLPPPPIARMGKP